MNQLKVLLVDDDATVHRAVRLRLGGKAALTCCRTSREALDLVPVLKFDVALIDVNLQEETPGTSLIPRLQELDADLTPIIFTAHADYSTAIESLEVHSFDFIPKSLGEDGQFFLKLERAARQTREQREKTRSQKDAGVLRATLSDARVDNELKLTTNDIQRGLLGESLESFSSLLGRVELMDVRLRQRLAGAPELADLAKLSGETLAELHEYIEKLRDYFAEPGRAVRSVNQVLTRAARLFGDSPELFCRRRVECRALKPDQPAPGDGRPLLRAVIVLSRLLLESITTDAPVSLKPSLILNPTVEMNALKGRPWARILRLPNFCKADKVAVAIDLSAPLSEERGGKVARMFSPAGLGQPGSSSWTVLAMVDRFGGALVVEAKPGCDARFRILFKV